MKGVEGKRQEKVIQGWVKYDATRLSPTTGHGILASFVRFAYVPTLTLNPYIYYFIFFVQTSSCVRRSSYAVPAAHRP